MSHFSRALTSHCWVIKNVISGSGLCGPTVFHIRSNLLSWGTWIAMSSIGPEKSEKRPKKVKDGPLAETSLGISLSVPLEVPP